MITGTGSFNAIWVIVIDIQINTASKQGLGTI